MATGMRVIPKMKRRTTRAGEAGRVPYGLALLDSCLECPLIKERVFCDMSRPTVAALDAISSSATYPKDAILFVEGQDPRGVFVICNGRVKLSTTSADGKSIIVRMAGPGEIVGLAGTLSGKTYELTAEAMEPIEANFIPKDAFVHFLKEHAEAAVRVAELLSSIYHATLLEVRYLGFASSTSEKLARFLLDLPAQAAAGEGYPRATLTLTHKEIGETIGASRETVTRLFASFKREGFIEVHGATVILSDKPKLEALVGG